MIFFSLTCQTYLNKSYFIFCILMLSHFVLHCMLLLYTFSFVLVGHSFSHWCGILGIQSCPSLHYYYLLCYFILISCWEIFNSFHCLLAKKKNSKFLLKKKKKKKEKKKLLIKGIFFYMLWYNFLLFSLKKKLILEWSLFFFFFFFFFFFS